MISRSLLLLLPLLAGVLAQVSCGAPGQGSGTDDLKVDLSEATATYQVLDLSTGAMTGHATLSDLQTSDAYRDNLMVFRLVSGSSTAVGTGATGFGAGVDPAATQAQVPAFYCGVFEVTQGQWQHLSATTPWTAVTATTSNPTTVLGSTATSTKRPVFGLSKDLLASVLTTYNAGRPHRLAIPSNHQWERACRAGTSTAFSWGNNANDSTTAANYAVVRETFSSQSGPRQVGERLPNAFGLFDMHGNVWELTHEGLSTSIRGGSWRDPLSLSRSANRVAIDRAATHGLVGVRLVLVP